MGDVEFWRSLEGTFGVPESREAGCPITMGRTALILFSQAEDLQARREECAKAK